jgi:hypothetical protein
MVVEDRRITELTSSDLAELDFLSGTMVDNSMSYPITRDFLESGSKLEIDSHRDYTLIARPFYEGIVVRGSRLLSCAREAMVHSPEVVIVGPIPLPKRIRL